MGGWCSAGEVNRTFESSSAAEKSTEEDDDNADMGDDKTSVMFFPRPTGSGGAGEIEGKKQQPKIEPRRTVNVSAGDAGAKARFEEGGGGADTRDGDEQKNGKMQGAKGIGRAPKKRAGAPVGGTSFARFFGKHP